MLRRTSELPVRGHALAAVVDDLHVQDRFNGHGVAGDGGECGVGVVALEGCDGRLADAHTVRHFLLAQPVVRAQVDKLLQEGVLGLDQQVCPAVEDLFADGCHRKDSMTMGCA